MRALVLGHREVLAALPLQACAQAMTKVLTEHARGATYMPLRSVMLAPGAAGFLGLMPAWRGPQPDHSAVFALKAVTVIPGNPARGLDAHQGLVTLFDGESGVPIAILDAGALLWLVRGRRSGAHMPGWQDARRPGRHGGRSGSGAAIASWCASSRS